MARYVVTYNDTFNDVEINGFNLMTDKEADIFEKLLESINWEIRYPLASGDEIIYSNGDDLLSRIEFKEVSLEEYKAIKKVFNSSFGVFIDEEFLNTLVEEESESSIDDEEESDDYYDGYSSHNSDDEDDDY